MALGAINHVAVTVGDLDRARSFYHPILEFLGYRLTLETEELMVWESHSTGSAINFWKAEPEFAGRRHERYAPGLHHIAFNADSRHEVEKFYALLTECGVNVLDPPAEYNDYAPGYFAVYFEDPDGIKLELAHIPGLAGGAP